MDKYLKKPLLIIAFSFLLIKGCSDKKDTITIAVASNFEKTLNKIIETYNQQRETSFNINVVSASSGVLTTQILNNAPFDLFLSADTEKPLLLKKKLKSQYNVVAYAEGQLALWIPNSKNSKNCIEELRTLKTLTMANPKTAPYGKVANDIVLKSNIQIDKIINASSVSQAYLYTLKNLSQAGFVAFPMLNKNNKGCIQTFKDEQLIQSMILLNEKARDLYLFILSDEVQNYIQNSGYIKAVKIKH